MITDICDKCGTKTFVFKHHILNQANFGRGKKNQGDTSKLCGNCHTAFHQHLGNKELKNKSIEWQYHTFFKWLYLGVIAGVVSLIFACF